MTARRETLEQVCRWVQSAEDDLLTARNMRALGRKSPHAIVGFHSQQCAEKYVKALLTLHSIDFPKTHDLIQLIARVPPPLRIVRNLAEAAFLSRFAVETRYPGNHEPVTAAEARKALRIARDFRRKLRPLLPTTTLGGRTAEEE